MIVLGTACSVDRASDCSLAGNTCAVDCVKNVFTVTSDWSPFVRCCVYNKPKVISAQLQPHIPLQKVTLLTRTHNTRLHFSSVYFYTRSQAFAAVLFWAVGSAVCCRADVSVTSYSSCL